MESSLDAAASFRFSGDALSRRASAARAWLASRLARRTPGQTLKGCSGLSCDQSFLCPVRQGLQDFSCRGGADLFQNFYCAQRSQLFGVRDHTVELLEQSPYAQPNFRRWRMLQSFAQRRLSQVAQRIQLGRRLLANGEIVAVEIREKAVELLGVGPDSRSQVLSQ